MRNVFIVVICMFFLTGCSAPQRISVGCARGNASANVDAVDEIGNLGEVSRVSVICKDGIVLAGLRLSGEIHGNEIYKKTLAILKRNFPDAERYLLGVDDEWAEDVIELNLYAEGGMEREILEKRFDFLVREKLVL